LSVIARIENLSKEYRLGVLNRRTFFADFFHRTLGTPSIKEASSFWALRNVSFDVREGEVLGILGRNGAGKSTLLKILSQITSPSSGRVLLAGRVASLLEVGTGFHLELTGRDNVFLNGAILGMTHREVAAKFDEIVAFSGVEEFIDTPVKRYSSGMRVRLAFAVAAHLEPEILIIDEVLAVGDAAFQQKCLSKMGDVAQGGRTILFVSHNAAAVESLCARGLVLDHGQVKFDGTQTEAIAFYARSYAQAGTCLEDRTDRTGTGEVRIRRIELRDPAGNALGSAQSGQDVDVWLFFENLSKEPHHRLNARINVTTALGLPVFTQSNQLAGTSYGELPEEGAFVCRIPRLPLPEAVYRIDFFVTSEYKHGEVFDSVPNALEFHVEGGDFFGSGKIPQTVSGHTLVEGRWRLEAAEPALRADGALEPLVGVSTAK
jgi:lipopolysaccharide transport system ATP-binding protein